MTAVKVGVAAHRECNRNGHEGNDEASSSGSGYKLLIDEIRPSQYKMRLLYDNN